MKSRPHCLVFPLVFAALISVTAQAQPLFKTEQSLEVATANAPRIYVAKIREIESVTTPGVPRKLQFDVRETIKGPHKPGREMSLSYVTPEQQAAHKQGTLVLVFDTTQPYTSQVISLTKEPTPKTLTADFQIIRDPDRLLKSTRQLAAATVGILRQESIRVRLPEQVVQDTDWLSYYRTGGGLNLRVPVDPQLEQRAKQWLRDYPNSPIMCEAAIDALRYFPTEENIKLVRSLLSDTSRDEQEQSGQRDLVKAAARRTLDYWGLSEEP